MDIQFNDIAKIDEVGIHVKDGRTFKFCDFKLVHGPDVYGNKCIGEREMLGKNPYMKFHMNEDDLVIKFNNVDTGSASIHLIMTFRELGYCTFDYS